MSSGSGGGGGGDGGGGGAASGRRDPFRQRPSTRQEEVAESEAFSIPILIRPQFQEEEMDSEQGTEEESTSTPNLITLQFQRLHSLLKNALKHMKVKTRSSTTWRQREDRPLHEFLEAEPISAGVQVQVEQEENQLGPADLQACLRQREWNRALDILSQMVRDGRAAGSAVSNDAQPPDITKAHPELVLLLRGQALFDLKGMGNAIRAHAYYLNYICEMYPSDFRSGIEFVDTLLADIHGMAQNEALSRNCRFNKKEKTRQCVNDYLKIYFPSFRDVEIKDGVLSIGLFGEKKGNEVRCLACHDFKKKKFSVRKLYYHQLCDPEGRQAFCPASTEYIRKKVQDVLQKPEAATDDAQEL